MGFRSNLLSGKFGLRRMSRRKEDTSERSAEATVLRALHLAARRSSPHKATLRANMARAISVIEASMFGLTQISELIDECEQLCKSAHKADNPEKYSLLSARYKEVVSEIDLIATSCGHSGVHLIGEVNTVFEVDLGEPGWFNFKLPHINLTSGPKGLALPDPDHAFGNPESLKQFDRHLGMVRSRLDKSVQIFRDHGENLAKRLALVLEGTYTEEHEFNDVPETTVSPLGRRTFR